MGIVDRLASAMDRRDEKPNIELAEALAESGDAAAVAELATMLTNAPRPLRHDAVKALYELAARRPALVAPHLPVFLPLLKAADNRMVWGAMQALASLCDSDPALVAPHLDAVVEGAGRGSVIAKDKAVEILARLSKEPDFAGRAWPLLVDRVDRAAVNQLPMYAEHALTAATANDPRALETVVAARLETVVQPAKRKRLEKVLRALAKL